ncbi:MAG: tetratricopeptide repeat protein [Cyclobacteriaceae bacterium]|nr:tetratricopeptide repeat protein [Cyclobacteriaceae bacterium]
MAKKDKNQGQGNDLIENPEVLAEEITKFEQFLEKNKTATFGFVALLLIVVGGYFGYNYYIEGKNKVAQTEMFQAVYYFEADSLDLALDGDGNNLGLKDIISDYRGTAAANLANFYAGVAFLKKEDYVSSILYLEDFSSSDILVQAKAYALIGDAYMQQNDFQNAVSYYNKAASYKENKYFSPGYLMKAALAYEKLNDKQGALKCYEKIVNDFSDASEVNDAKKHKARLSAKAS